MSQCGCKINHDITKISDENKGQLFISDYNTAVCKAVIDFYNIKAVINVSNRSYEPITSNYFEHGLDDDSKTKLFPAIEFGHFFKVVKAFERR